MLYVLSAQCWDYHGTSTVKPQQGIKLTLVLPWCEWCLLTIPKPTMSPKRILVTGSNGFLGTHILRQLLSKPEVTVRAVVRSSSKVEAVKRDFPNAGNLDFAIVPDITAEGAFDDALRESEEPFDAVIHSASPFLYRAVSDNREFLDPAMKGTTEILKAVKAVAPAVKRVVITSSFAAVGDLANPEKMKGKHYSDDDWNPITWDEALTSSKGAAYQGSKKFAEVCSHNCDSVLGLTCSRKQPGPSYATRSPPLTS